MPQRARAMLPRFLAAAIAALALTALTTASPPDPAAPPVGSIATLTLRNGDTLTGTLTALNDESVSLLHSVLGLLQLPRSAVAAIAPPPAADAPAQDNTAPAAAATDQPEPAPAPPPPAAPTPEPPPPPASSHWLTGWNGTVELGLHGSDGNTERLNLRAAITGNRKSTRHDTRLSLRYAYVTDHGDETENRLIFDARNDWTLSPGSRWRLFALGSIELDEFQEWDYRWNAAGGVAYAFIETDRTSLLGRLGAGASQEVGGDENTIRPEGLLGLDFSHKLSDRQKITASATYFPDLGDFPEFRLVANTAYEILVDPDSNMSLKLGVEDRYDSTPSAGASRNDIDYFIMLVFSW